MSHILAAMAMVLMVLAGCSTTERKPPAMKVPFDPAYTGFNRVLADYVHGDRVDYAGLKSKQSLLDTVVSRLSNLDSSGYATMSPVAREAYLINAANAATLWMIVNAYPIKTIDAVDSARARTRWRLAGQSVTLRALEDTLLPALGDPRFHLAVSCGSLSCPPLPQRAMRPGNLDRQLDDICRQFVNNPKWTAFDYMNHTITTSALFSRYGSEFQAKYSPGETLGGLAEPQVSTLNFFLAYLDPPLRDRVDLSAQWTLTFRPENPALDDTER